MKIKKGSGTLGSQAHAALLIVQLSGEQHPPQSDCRAASLTLL